MAKSKIEWTDYSWNPVTGCSKISEGCKNCYAERMAKRLAGRFGYPKDNPFKVTLHPNKLNQPLKWKKSKMIFVCSMSDLFHFDIPKIFIDKIFSVIKACPQHIFIILTKRTFSLKEKIYGIAPDCTHREIYFDNSLPKNLWLGVSVENQKTANERIPILLQIPAAIRFVSCEPMLGSVDFSHLPESGAELDWVIVGGESGPHARPMYPDWVRIIRDQCQNAGIPFFFKQWGEWRFNPLMTSTPWNNRFEKVGKKKAGRRLDGREWNQYPVKVK